MPAYYVIALGTAVVLGRALTSQVGAPDGDVGQTGRAWWPTKSQVFVAFEAAMTTPEVARLSLPLVLKTSSPTATPFNATKAYPQGARYIPLPGDQ